jgi:hypothetical protein
VGRDLALDARATPEFGDDQFHGARIDRVAGLTGLVPAAEGREGAAAAPAIEPRAPVGGQRGGCLVVEVDGATLPPLRAVDMGGALLQVEIPTAQGAEFGDADAGAKEREDERDRLQPPQLPMRLRFARLAFYIIADAFEVGEPHVGRWGREAGDDRGDAHAQLIVLQCRVEVVGREEGVELADGGETVLRRAHPRDILGRADVLRHDRRQEVGDVLDGERCHRQLGHVALRLARHELGEAPQADAIRLLRARREAQGREEVLDGEGDGDLASALDMTIRGRH